jgi:uncharacterized membrane protein
MRPIRIMTMAAVWTVVAGLAVPGAQAQAAVRLTTPYPAVSVEPGQSTTFDLQVTGPGRTRVDLAVTDQPRGWTATLQGGGFVVGGVFTDPEAPPQVQLEVAVPAEAQEGTYAVAVRATSSAGNDTLDLDLRVTGAVQGSVELTAEFPSLRGASDATFNFNLDLANNTPEETTFSLEAVGPEGWQVDARPTAQTQAATATVEGGSTAGVTVDVDPPDDVTAGAYPVLVRATGSGRTAEAELQVEITGNFALTLTTPDERLNADVVAGDSTDVELLVLNEGTAPLVGVTLSATPPTDWEVTFTPELVDQVPPGEVARVNATITPSGDSVAGDYIVTITANIPEANSEIELRTTVKTSGLWGIIGLLLIVAALGGLGYVFRTYGRR